ncbi:hypothetical protein AWC38_SpisGene10979 [Stylophora pistillata]|uniref:Fibrinogen C-terminal domain-containing protein n=2 Tax=Stylophora pistillata TaxID=50429 RepID=A0A2B4S751_STYPI|nr:hypothetical protein AWC38_SpisGene10979 [Stylophora pistillata]
MCAIDVHCKSVNFFLINKSCDLNEADRHSHPKDYRPFVGCVYMEMSTPFKKSCAEIQQVWPKAKSGYYWIKIGSKEAQVYCDMKNYGGGWTLVVTISSTNNDHLESAKVNCLNLELCVPLPEKDITARKLQDIDIHDLLHSEGTFRVDVLGKNENYTIFHQIPSGPENFDSTCVQGRCPRIIISYSFPYQWETNDCTEIDVGYRIFAGCHRVFDGQDDRECGHLWFSSKYHGRRTLYGYCSNSHGIYQDKSGMMFVK